MLFAVLCALCALCGLFIQLQFTLSLDILATQYALGTGLGERAYRAPSPNRATIRVLVKRMLELSLALRPVFWCSDVLTSWIASIAKDGEKLYPKP